MTSRSQVNSNSLPFTCIFFGLDENNRELIIIRLFLSNTVALQLFILKTNNVCNIKCRYRSCALQYSSNVPDHVHFNTVQTFPIMCTLIQFKRSRSCALQYSSNVPDHVHFNTVVQTLPIKDNIVYKKRWSERLET